MGKLLGWVTATHTLRYHAHNHTSGTGHLYQGPFKSFPCQDDEHFLVVCRYVERNALSGKLVAVAEDWEYCSLHRWHHKRDRNPPLLTSWPIARPRGWTKRVNEALTQRELQSVRESVVRNRPFGSEAWTEETCERTGLWATTRPRGRPRKKPQIESTQESQK
ncbi:hypothetical protein CA13_52790 [Planctomycetes bacterium CA13]|uniref:Transposase n=2 Tax=Novipirellula herctigrandis TaxID=2527986 RepID=A0A5C5Z9C9_9BACT|nr:hypothetical protein CA13_52790 [Planctomycetes bacterium CA13]